MIDLRIYYHGKVERDGDWITPEDAGTFVDLRPGDYLGVSGRLCMVTEIKGEWLKLSNLPDLKDGIANMQCRILRNESPPPASWPE